MEEEQKEIVAQYEKRILDLETQLRESEKQSQVLIIYCC